MKILMIRPILPPIPPLPDISADNAMQLLSCTVFLLAVITTALCISLYASKKWNGDKKKTALAFIGISVAVATLLLCFFGCAVSAVKGILLCFLLVFCSYSDIKSREVSDYLHVMILLTAFINCEISKIPQMVLAAVLVTLPMLIIVILCKGKAIGGADVKLSAACAFMLGITKGYVGLIVGLASGILVNIIIQMRKNKAEGFPLVPYLAAAYMAAYFI
ncbi:MAG: A24 family peptidase [Oscillospiraceae bacterium]|nr:A24 family peptidase [Oscillospiraceae bacterium]